MIYFDSLRIHLLFDRANFDSIYDLAKWHVIDILLLESGNLGFWVGQDLEWIPREHRYICSFRIEDDEIPLTRCGYISWVYSTPSCRRNPHGL